LLHSTVSLLFYSPVLSTNPQSGQRLGFHLCAAHHLCIVPPPIRGVERVERKAYSVIQSEAHESVMDVQTGPFSILPVRSRVLRRNIHAVLFYSGSKFQLLQCSTFVANAQELVSSGSVPHRTEPMQSD
jgi:hypothetical protein